MNAYRLRITSRLTFHRVSQMTVRFGVHIDPLTGHYVHLTTRPPVPASDWSPSRGIDPRVGVLDD